MTSSISSAVAHNTRSHEELGRGHRVPKPVTFYGDDDDEKESNVSSTRHWRNKNLPYPTTDRSAPAKRSYSKTLKHEKPTPSLPTLSYGRKYTTGVEFSSTRSQTCFTKLWNNTQKPRQNKNFKARCQRYFAALRDSGSDPALKWVTSAPSKDPDLGVGVIATRKIKKGTLIGHYAGVMQKIQESSSSFIFTFTGVDIGNWYIDAGAKGNVMSCVNANEQDPNVNVHEYYGGLGPRIIFVADKDIDAGQELFISYGKKYWDNMSFRPKKVSD